MNAHLQSTQLFELNSKQKFLLLNTLRFQKKVEYVHVVLNKTVVNHDNLCGSRLQRQSEMYLWLLIIIIALMKKRIIW